MLMKMKTPLNTNSGLVNINKDRRFLPKFLSLLVCPLTLSGLIYDKERSQLVSLQAGLSYPIKGHVPIMLEEAGEPLTDELRAIYTKTPPPPPPKRGLGKGVKIWQKIARPKSGP